MTIIRNNFQYLNIKFMNTQSHNTIAIANKMVVNFITLSIYISNITEQF